MVPLSDPPHPLTLAMLLPDPAEIVKLVVLPWATLREVGLIVPLPVPVVVVLTVVAADSTNVRLRLLGKTVAVRR